MDTGKYANYFKSLLIIILFIWTIMAGTRTLLNLIKIPFEERGWIFMSDLQKRSILYGDLLPIYKKINNSTTPNESIYLITNDGKAYFLLRFLLYPRRIFWVSGPDKIKKTNSQHFLLLYHEPEIKAIGKNKIYSFGNVPLESDLYKI